MFISNATISLFNAQDIVSGTEKIDLNSLEQNLLKNYLPLAGGTVSNLNIGSNLYVNDSGSNVLVVSGNVAILDSLVIDGNLRVNGETTVIYTENTSIRNLNWRFVIIC